MATNPTLHEILSTEKGPACIKSLAWVMFGGLEDGAQIIVEPLLEEDVTIDLEKNSALVAIRFGVKAPDKRHQWTGKGRREFDNLEQALAEAEKAMEAHGAEALQQAVMEKESEAKRTTLKRKKKRSMFQDRWGRKNKKKKDDPFTIFIKATTFVRGMGASTIHPSAKLRLFGLLMQAQQGNIPEGDQGKASDLPGFRGSALALQKLKLRAWQSQKNKKREEAMKEYVELVTSLAPQWKVAHILGGNHSFKNNKPRQMMWVLKVNYCASKSKCMSKLRIYSTGGRSVALLGRHHVTTVEVLQSSNATSATLWVEDGIGSMKRRGEGKKPSVAAGSASGGVGGAHHDGEEEEDDYGQDLFIKNMPKEWSLSDCIVDKSKFATIDAQRAHFQERMREMARADHEEEDGWKFYAKTRLPSSIVSAELDEYVYREKEGTLHRSLIVPLRATHPFFALPKTGQARRLAARRTLVLSKADEDSSGDGGFQRRRSFQLSSRQIYKRGY